MLTAVDEFNSIVPAFNQADKEFLSAAVSFFSSVSLVALPIVNVHFALFRMKTVFHR
jgi:hypothetical protein